MRWGGEEFLIVARFLDRKKGPELAEKVRAAVEAHDFRLEDGTLLKRTCSVGFAAFRSQPGGPGCAAGRRSSRSPISDSTSVYSTSKPWLVNLSVRLFSVTVRTT